MNHGDETDIATSKDSESITSPISADWLHWPALTCEPPDFLLGALLSVAQESATLDAAQRAHVAAVGRKQLEERATGKRAWKSWSRAKELHSVTLSSAQVREIIEALGEHAPENSAQLIASFERIAHGVER